MLNENIGSFFGNLEVLTGHSQVSGTVVIGTSGSLNGFRGGSNPAMGGLVRNSAGSFSVFLPGLKQVGGDVFWKTEINNSGSVATGVGGSDGFSVKMRGVGSAVSPFLAGAVTVTTASFDLLSGSTQADVPSNKLWDFVHLLLINNGNV
jgi:hypothetical protein